MVLDAFLNGGAQFEVIHWMGMRPQYCRTIHVYNIHTLLLLSLLLLIIIIIVIIIIYFIVIHTLGPEMS